MVDSCVCKGGRKATEFWRMRWSWGVVVSPRDVRENCNIRGGMQPLNHIEELSGVAAGLNVIIRMI